MKNYLEKVCEMYNIPTEQENNPKQILIDWIDNINVLAAQGRDYTKANSYYKDELSEKERLDMASDYFANIIGQCTAIQATLKNSN